jgi:hypothetical protein
VWWQEFKGHGMFEGRIVKFNGAHYKVYYPEDGDEESLSEYELDELDIVEDSDQEAVTVADAAAKAKYSCGKDESKQE